MLRPTWYRQAAASALIAIAAAGCSNEDDVATRTDERADAARADTVRRTGPPAPIPLEPGGVVDDVVPVTPREVDPQAWTAGVTDVAGAGRGLATLLAVRTAQHADYERVVFELDASTGYHIEYIDRPVRQCGSGDAVPLAGDAWLEVRLEPANAHTEEGRATVRERSRTLNYPLIRELKLTCDFEAQVVWVLGVASPNRYRAFELVNPARIVVDIRR